MAEKLTVTALESMAMGATETFTLPSARACDTGKALAYQYQNILGCKFSMQTNYTTNQLTITKNPA